MIGGTAENYRRGIAFVVEGATERVFYHEYLKWCCANIDDARILQLPKGDYAIAVSGEGVLVKFYVAGSIGSVPNALNWARSTCCGRDGISWRVALCYDTDGNEILNLSTRAWQRFRQDLEHMELPVIDLAADADIEDVMLADIEGVRSYLGLNGNVEPRGKKGKAKLNSLFKAVDVTRPYHEGDRARDLIQHLSFAAIEENAPIPLKDIRDAVFGAV